LSLNLEKNAVSSFLPSKGSTKASQNEAKLTYTKPDNFLNSHTGTNLKLKVKSHSISGQKSLTVEENLNKIGLSFKKKNPLATSDPMNDLEDLVLTQGTPRYRLKDNYFPEMKLSSQKHPAVKPHYLGSPRLYQKIEHSGPMFSTY